MSKKLIGGLMLFVMVLGVGGISPAEEPPGITPDVSGRMGLASQLVKEERYEEALELYKEMLKSDDTEVNIGAHRGYQNVMRILGKQDEVKKEYQAKLGKEPKRAMWHYLYGRLLGEEALEVELKEAIKLDPKFFWAYYGLGHFYKDNKKWSEAIKEFQEAIKIKPDSAEAVHSLALVYYYSGELETAEATWCKAQERAPHRPEIALGLGICYKAQGKYDEAIKVLESILETDPNYWKVYEPLIQCYHAKQDYKKGEELRNKIQELYTQTKDKEFLKQERITIDIIRVDKTLVIASEKLGKTKDGMKFIFKLYYKGIISEPPDKIIESGKSYPEALKEVKSILTKEEKE